MTPQFSANHTITPQFSANHAITPNSFSNHAITPNFFRNNAILPDFSSSRYHAPLLSITPARPFFSHNHAFTPKKTADHAFTPSPGGLINIYTRSQCSGGKTQWERRSFLGRILGHRKTFDRSPRSYLNSLSRCKKGTHRKDFVETCDSSKNQSHRNATASQRKPEALPL